MTGTPGRPSLTGPSFSRVPSSSVQAPGTGVQARISRPIAAAGRAQSTRASATLILGAKLTPSAGCGLRAQLARLDPVQGGHQQPGPGNGEPPEQVARGVGPA